MMRTVKPTSPMSVGTWIGGSAFSASAGLRSQSKRMIFSSGRGDSFAAEGHRGRREGSRTRVERQQRRSFAAPLAAYTAVLLSDTATPLWQGKLPRRVRVHRLGAGRVVRAGHDHHAASADERGAAAGADGGGDGCRHTT